MLAQTAIVPVSSIIMTLPSLINFLALKAVVCKTGGDESFAHRCGEDITEKTSGMICCFKVRLFLNFFAILSGLFSLCAL